MVLEFVHLRETRRNVCDVSQPQGADRSLRIDVLTLAASACSPWAPRPKTTALRGHHSKVQRCASTMWCEIDALSEGEDVAVIGFPGEPELSPHDVAIESSEPMEQAASGTTPERSTKGRGQKRKVKEDSLPRGPLHGWSD